VGPRGIYAFYSRTPTSIRKSRAISQSAHQQQQLFKYKRKGGPRPSAPLSLCVPLMSLPPPHALRLADGKSRQITITREIPLISLLSLCVCVCRVLIGELKGITMYTIDTTCIVVHVFIVYTSEREYGSSRGYKYMDGTKAKVI
jgi:hypothetical protein